MAGERGLAAGTVRCGTAGLVDQSGVPEGLEDPPAGLDVFGRVGAVGVGHVDPERHPFGHVLPLLDVLHHRLAAVSVELGDAVLLDRGLAVEAEHLLDFDLDGQAVSVPAALARDSLAAHGLVAGEEVLEHAREHVVDAGRAVGGRRAFVEGVDVVFGTFLDRAAEDVALAPELADALLELEMGHQRADGSEGLVAEGWRRRVGFGGCGFGRGRVSRLSHRGVSPRGIVSRSARRRVGRCGRGLVGRAVRQLLRAAR